jgi:Cdc6-like AAA superfamily ATPase
MDFPERLNVKVSSRMGHFRLVFSPYTQPEIMQVVEDRLKGCTLFTQRAVMFASKKLAGYSSDIRTILGVLLKAVK